MTNTRIVTYLTYSELFGSFERNGLILSSSSFKTTESCETQIEYLLRDLNPVELVQFSSFLNMICQTRSSEMTMVRGVSLLEEVGLIPKGTGFSDKIVFHRESLLNLIGLVLTKNINGSLELTGQGHLENQKKYSQALLINNDSASIELGDVVALSKGLFLRDHFLKEWPHYYLPETANSIYGRRITRYKYCYDTLLPTLEQTDLSVMGEGIRLFEEESGVPLAEYMHVVSGLYTWFLQIPIHYEKTPPPPDQRRLGFDFQNISSFYINSALFEGNPSLIKTVDSLSKDISDLRSVVAEEREARDPITGYNQNIRVFFDNPIFKISDGYYCVTDLKFLLENACGGLLWRVRTGKNPQNFKSAYGRLMEKYFRFLIQNIFPEAKVTCDESIRADAIVERGDTVFVFEFTTEYYRFASLYNPSQEGFLDDAYRLLFNAGKDDLRSRGKKEVGKLVKLNEYIREFVDAGKQVVPVLVTENIFGNKELFNAFDGFYNQEISNKNLTNLQNNPPLFLCLDDLETFWGLFEAKGAVEGFLGFAKEWEATDKGPQFHNATAGMCRFVEKRRGGEARICNRNFASFFAG